MSLANKEKRLSIRKYITLKVGINTEIGVIVRSAENISKTGMFITSDTYYEPGTLLDLVIDLNGKKLDVQGRVIWCTTGQRKSSNAGMGVILGSIGPEEQEILDKFLDTP